jgi:hypothetical protein
MAHIETNLGNIDPGSYNFAVAFYAPVSAVATPETVQDTVAAKLRIPEEHELRVIESNAVYPGLTRYGADATFVNWESDNPAVHVARVGIEVNAPDLVTRAFAWIRRREANATVIAQANGSEPFGGGQEAGPDPTPLPVSPLGGLLRF